MNKFSVGAFSLCMGLFLSMGVISDAEAKRLGGGKSFGSKTFQNKPAKRTDSSKTNSAQNKAQQQNSAQKQALSKKGGMMGMLGGLMIGGMLGAMFFGGAFENINFMDILLFGGIAFLLFKIFTSRKQPQAQTANGAPAYEPDPEYERAQDNTQSRQAIENNGSNDTSSENLKDAHFDQEPESILETGKIPRGFDQKSFLTGAENVFTLLQNAWDNGELGDLRQFCSDEVFGEIQEQIRAREDNNTTTIIALKSELVNVVKSDNSTEATVVFNAELKENDKFVNVQEAWYFVRADNRQENNWLLDGIQQLED